MDHLYLILLFAPIISFLVTLYFVPLMSKIAFRLNILDLPDGVVKKHKAATPYLGGVAIYLGFIVALCLVYPFENKSVFFLLGSTLLLFIGLIDDLVVTKPYQKFFGQCIAALCFVKAGFHLKENFFLLHYWQLFFSLFWIVLVVNAFNLVDVMDGLATSLALLASINFLAIALLLQQYNVALLLLSLIGGLGAFLWYNRPPARIYLGDAGSLFIGGFLATIPFLLSWSHYNAYGLLTPCIILAIPLLEVATLIIVRTYKRIPFYNASPDHFSIYLRLNGWSVPAILWYIGGLSCTLGMVAYAFILNYLSLGSVMALGMIFLVIWLIILHKKI